MAGMRLLRAAIAILGVTLLAGCAVATPGPPPAGSITARVVHIDFITGLMIVEWDTGRTSLTMDTRALGTYGVGDTILLDRFFRPLGGG